MLNERVAIFCAQFICEKATANDFKKLNKDEIKLLIEVFKFGRSENLLIEFLLNNNLESSISKNDIKELSHNSNARKIHNLKAVNLIYLIKHKLSSMGINFLFLKGSHLIIDIYKKKSKRMLRDIDILFHEKDLKKLSEGLHQIGFNVSSLKVNKNYYDLKVAKNNMGVPLELHHRISDSPLCKFKDNFFSSQGKLGNNKYLSSTENLFLHLVYHSTSKQGFDVGIQVLFDIYEIFKVKNNELDIDKLIRLSKTYDIYAETLIFIQLMQKFFYIKIKIDKKTTILKYTKEELIQFISLILLNSSNKKAYKLRSFMSSDLYNKNMMELIFKRNFNKALLIKILKYFNIAFSFVINKNLSNDTAMIIFFSKKFKNINENIRN